MIWRWQQCVHIHNLIMRYYIGAQFPRIDLPSPESDQHNSNAIPTISFHIYQHISHCNVHYRHPFNEKKECQLCEVYTYAIVTEKLCTRKYSVVID